MRFELNVRFVIPFSVDCIISRLLHHVLLDTLRQSNGISATRLNKVRKVRDEVTFRSLLLGEGVRIDVSKLAQVLIKCGLPRQFTPVNLFGPEWVLSQVLPGDALHGIFLEQPAQKVSEEG